MKNGLKTGLVLLIIAFVCGALLAVVNSFTASVIEERKQAEIKKSLGDVYPNLDDCIVEEITEGLDDSIESAYLIKSGDTKVGVIYVVSKNGYVGPVKTMIAINKDKEVIGMKIVDESESMFNGSSNSFGMIGATKAGLGSTVKDGNDDFDHVAGSTVTSTAVFEAFKAAFVQADKDLA